MIDREKKINLFAQIQKMDTCHIHPPKKIAGVELIFRNRMKWMIFRGYPTSAIIKL